MQIVQQLENVSTNSNAFLLDEDGFLQDPSIWTRAFSEQQASNIGVELSDKHWRLIEMIRGKYLTLGALPPMRSVCKSVGFEKSELKSQFGSCLTLWKIAGLPHPGQEAISYMN